MFDPIFNVAFQQPANLDTSKLFLHNAGAYWKAGLPVFPLWPKKKEPMFGGWREYSVVMPHEEIREQWRLHHQNSNIGLPLGPCSGVSVIDIDTDDETVIKAILSVLPKPLWVRKGAKGAVLGYKYNPALKTFRIRTMNNESIVEYLSEGTYVVLPPSIHPKTDQPYVENTPLHMVKDALVGLALDIEQKLRSTLKAKGVNVNDNSSNPTRVTDFVPAGARDISLTRAAGLFAFAVLRGERSLLEALDMLHLYGKQYVENIVGDPIDMNKHTANLLLFLSRDIMQKNRVLPEGWDSGMSPEQKNHYSKVFSADRMEKPAVVIMEELTQLFANNGGKGTDTVMTEVEKLLKLMAFSTNLNDMEVDRILALISRESGLHIRVTSLHKQIKKYREANLFKGENHTEIAQALIEELETINKIKFHNGNFYRWGGSHYEIYPAIEIEREIHLRYGSCGANKRRSDTKGILQTVSSLQAYPLKDQDIVGHGVNFANGYLTRLPDGAFELQPHDPKWGCTYTFPFLVDMSAIEDPVKNDLRKLAPTFHQFLESSWGYDFDFKEKVLALQEALFATIFGLAPQYQRAFLLFGVAGSGKSQLLTIISSLVPPEVKSAVSPDVWGETFSVVDMVGKLLNIAGELSESKGIKGQIFKEVIDGTEMMVRAPFGQAFTTQMIAAQWFAGNFLPKTKDTSDGFNRRWLIFAFTKAISDKDKKINLGNDIVNTERAGIIQWCLSASKRLHAQKSYTIPPSSVRSVAEMGSINNTIRAFLEANHNNLCIASRDLTEKRILGSDDLPIKPMNEEKAISCYLISETKLYELYWAWAVTNTNKKPDSLQGFKQAMKELCLSFSLTPVCKSSIDYYQGLALKDSARLALSKIGFKLTD